MNEKIKMFLKILKLEREAANKTAEFWRNEKENETDLSELENIHYSIGYFSASASSYQHVINMINEYFESEQK